MDTISSVEIHLSLHICQVILIDNRNTFNPYINLAIEEFLIRQANCDIDDYLFLYINDPCIVLGKNQSIYKEINFDYLRNNELQLCRRISGGGTVYQDKGNLNFAFISQFSEHKINNYKLFNKPVVNALIKAGIPAEMDARNNIICKGKKISGNAQFTNRKNIISHGTLLFDANLPVLRSCLKQNDFSVESKAVSSVKSSVANSKEYTDTFSSIYDVRYYLAEELLAIETYSFTDVEWATIVQSATEKFSSYAWIYGRTPTTYIKKNDLQITVNDGKIEHITSSLSNDVNTTLIGVEYSYQHIKKALSNVPNASQLLELIF